MGHPLEGQPNTRFGYITGDLDLDAGLVPGHRWECYMVFGADAHTAAVCECGWNGPKRQLLGLAEDDGEAHALCHSGQRP